LLLKNGTAYLLPGIKKKEENNMNWQGLTKEQIQLDIGGV
jgi:hypothetical protein